MKGVILYYALKNYCVCCTNEYIDVPVSCSEVCWHMQVNSLRSAWQTVAREHEENEWDRYIRHIVLSQFGSGTYIVDLEQQC